MSYLRLVLYSPLLQLAVLFDFLYDLVVPFYAVVVCYRASLQNVADSFIFRAATTTETLFHGHRRHNLGREVSRSKVDIPYVVPSRPTQGNLSNPHPASLIVGSVFETFGEGAFLYYATPFLSS